MKDSHIYLFLCMNCVATVVAYNYRICYDSFSLCLITNNTEDRSNRNNNKFLQTRSSAEMWCRNRASMLAVITSETIQSAVEAFMNDPSAKLINLYVLTNGYRYDLSTLEWVNERKSAILPRVSYNTARYVYLVVSTDRSHLLYGFAHEKKEFICSYVTHNSSCSSGFRQLGRSCYKIHNTTATWFAARNICLKEESDLASLQNDISSLTLEWIREYWIGLRIERWDWLNHQTNYGEIKYSNWEDSYPRSTGDCLCLNARTGKWIKCDCLPTYRYICIQDYVPSSTSNVSTTQTTRIITTTTQIATTTTKLKTKTATTEFGDSTSQFHSTPNRTQSGNSAVAVETGQPLDFLPFVGIGIACLLIFIVVIVVVVFIKNRRSRSDEHEPTHGNSPPPMTSYKDDAPNTVYAAVVPNTNDQVYSASDKNSNQTVYAELDLESKRNTGPTQRVSVKVRFTSEEIPSQAVYAEVNQVSKKNMNEKAEGPSVYDNYNQLMVDSVYANSAQTKV